MMACPNSSLNMEEDTDFNAYTTETPVHSIDIPRKCAQIGCKIKYTPNAAGYIPKGAGPLALGCLYCENHLNTIPGLSREQVNIKALLNWKHQSIRFCMSTGFMEQGCWATNIGDSVKSPRVRSYELICKYHSDKGNHIPLMSIVDIQKHFTLIPNTTHAPTASHNEATLIIWDTETAMGIEEQTQDQPITLEGQMLVEIGAISCTLDSLRKPNIKLISSYSELIQTRQPISFPNISNISNPMITKENAISTQEAIIKFLEWVQGHKNPIMIAHNGFKFDLPIMLQELKPNRVGNKEVEEVVMKILPNIPQVDTLKLFKTLRPNTSCLKLTCLARDLGLEISLEEYATLVGIPEDIAEAQAHRARYDSYVTLSVLAHISNHLSPPLTLNLDILMDSAKIYVNPDTFLSNIECIYAKYLS